MLKYHGDLFWWLSQKLGQAFAVLDRPRDRDEQIDPETRALLVEDLKGARLLLENAGLRVSLSVISAQHDLIEKKARLTINEALSSIDTARVVVQHELETILLLQMESDKRTYFEDRELFGSSVAAKFPVATFDIEEAGKCLALERYTACVFHLMRVMEVGLNALGAKLSIPAMLPTWDAKLKKIGDALDALDKKVVSAQDWEFLQEARHYFRAVQIARRNPTMHIDKTYTGEVATETLAAIRAFMRHLATQLGDEAA